jgi:transcriptional activator of cad operon
MSAQVRGAAWQIGAWIADPSDDTLTRGPECQKIEPRMMRLLLCLARSPGTVMSQEQLLSEVWAGVVVGSASVYQSISQLRKVLGDTGSPPSYIETVARKGYRLIAPVRRIEEGRFDAPGMGLVPVREPVVVSLRVVGPAADGTTLLAPRSPNEPGSGPPNTPRSWSAPRWRWALGAAAVALVAIATAALLLWVHLTAGPTEPSVVVLPIVDMTEGRTEQPLCDGVTEELSNWLGQIPTLKVVSRTSAFAFRDQKTDVREIGRRLGTTHVLEGSLRRSGNVFRISVQLVATSSGFHVWSGSYDSTLTDVIQIQEQVARAVANNLELRLGDDTTSRLAGRRSASGRAYSIYLVARHHQQQRTKQDNDRAIELYKNAISADPSFALAQVGLAYAYLNQRFFNSRPIEEIAADAQPLLAKAAQNAPELADVYIVRGALENELITKDAALRDLKRGAALNPNSRDAAAELGFYYLVSGEPRQALGYYNHAAQLDPLDYNLHAQRCTALADLAEFDGAGSACEQARALEPSSAWAYSASSAFEEACGRLAEALRLTEQAILRSPGVLYSYADRGRWLLSLGQVERLRDNDAAAAGKTDSDVHLMWIDLVSRYANGDAAGLRQLLDANRATNDSSVLFVLARAELLAGDDQAARALVDKALSSPELTSEDLASPWEARTGSSALLVTAVALQATGDAAGARARLDQLTGLLDRLIAAGMRRHGVYELQAQVAALRGKPEDAINALQHAADLGWRDVWLAEHEPFFAALRGRADFDALLSTVRARNEADVRDLAINGPRS